MLRGRGRLRGRGSPSWLSSPLSEASSPSGIIPAPPGEDTGRGVQAASPGPEREGF